MLLVGYKRCLSSICNEPLSFKKNKSNDLNDSNDSNELNGSNDLTKGKRKFENSSDQLSSRSPRSPRSPSLHIFKKKSTLSAKRHHLKRKIDVNMNANYANYVTANNPSKLKSTHKGVLDTEIAQFEWNTPYSKDTYEYHPMKLIYL